jgi:hypothetical protein
VTSVCLVESSDGDGEGYVPLIGMYGSVLTNNCTGAQQFPAIQVSKTCLGRVIGGWAREWSVNAALFTRISIVLVSSLVSVVSMIVCA